MRGKRFAKEMQSASVKRRAFGNGKLMLNVRYGRECATDRCLERSSGVSIRWDLTSWTSAVQNVDWLLSWMEGITLLDLRKTDGGLHTLRLTAIEF